MWKNKTLGVTNNGDIENVKQNLNILGRTYERTYQRTNERTDWRTDAIVATMSRFC